MTNAEKFVELIAELYPMGDKQATQMQRNSGEIENELSKYYWDDIKAKVQYFYARKNDKSRPRIGQILALLETDPKITVRVEEKIEPDTTWQRPHTKLWSINQTFEKLVNVLMNGGVIPNERGKYVNNRSLVDPETDDVILNPFQWLKWKLADAMQEQPDLFAKFPNTTELEGLAIAIQGGLINFKVRDWVKMALNMPVDKRKVSTWYNLSTETEKQA